MDNEVKDVRFDNPELMVPEGTTPRLWILGARYFEANFSPTDRPLRYLTSPKTTLLPLSHPRPVTARHGAAAAITQRTTGRLRRTCSKRWMRSSTSTLMRPPTPPMRNASDTTQENKTD